MKRFDLINWFIKKFNYKSYLEIGVYGAACFDKVECKSKIGVDPFKGKTIKDKFYRVTSDEFFAKNERKFDIIFIDGLHQKKQVLRDIENGLECLNNNGTIILHDCNPRNNKEGAEIKTCGRWNGTVWKAYSYLRATREDLIMRVLNIDYGCGIIRRGKQELYNGQYREFSDFNLNREEILQFITMEELWQICV